MGQALIDRRWQEYLSYGQVTVGASLLKGVLGVVGLILLSALSAGIGYDAYQQDGVSSLKTWGCALVSVLVLVGALVPAAPLVRRRRLVLTGSGLVVTSRRGASRITELGLRWEQVEGVTIHRSSNGEGSTSVDVRMILATGVRTDHPTGKQYGHIDLPTGFQMSKKDLAALMERVRLSYK